MAWIANQMDCQILLTTDKVDDYAVVISLHGLRLLLDMAGHGWGMGFLFFCCNYIMWWLGCDFGSGRSARAASRKPESASVGAAKQRIPRGFSETG